MFKKLDSVKALKTLIKLAAVALTSPATVAVASGLYPIQPLTRVVVSVAALILVEGCLLLGWQMLDESGKTATLTQRILYASLAWVAYFALFGIALYHDEGLAGIVFRLTLGVLLVYASAEAGLLAELRQKERVDKDINNDPAVKRYARKLSREMAKAELDLKSRMGVLERDAREQVYSQQLKQDTEATLKAMCPAPTQPSRIAKLDSQSTNSLDKANHRRKLTKEEAMTQVLQLLHEHPDMGVPEIADQIGRSRQRVYDYMGELKELGHLPQNGNHQAESA